MQNLQSSSHLPFAPGPRGVREVFKQLNLIKESPIHFFQNLSLKYGPVTSINFGGIRMTAITDPSDVRYVLQENASNYTKSIMYNHLKPILGEGLLTSEGSFWKKQRRIAQPAFKKSMIESFSKVVLEESQALVSFWKPGSQIDISKEMMKITFTIVGRALFNHNLGPVSDSIGASLSIALEEVMHKIQNNIFAIPLYIPTRRNLRMKKAIREMDAVVYDIIMNRRKTGGGQGDLLDFLMNAKDEETGEAMSDKQLRDEVITFMLAGHETTSNALAWTFYLLSIYPDVGKKVREEARSVLARGPLNFESIEKLRYTQSVIMESMRVFPPIWAIERTPIEDDVIGGYHIPKGSIVTLCIYQIHRNESDWENPEGFDPERFTTENSATRHNYSYIPFGGGPRTCIGNSFAMMEATLILAYISSLYDLRLVSGQNIQMDPMITLRPKNGIFMKVFPNQ